MMNNLMKILGLVLITGILFAGTINAQDKSTAKIAKDAKKECCSKEDMKKCTDSDKAKCDHAMKESKDSKEKCSAEQMKECKSSMDKIKANKTQTGDAKQCCDKAKAEIPKVKTDAEKIKVK